jgi:DNA-directed RNA polymerase specialized sigma24 family protein
MDLYDSTPWYHRLAYPVSHCHTVMYSSAVVFSPHAATSPHDEIPFRLKEWIANPKTPCDQFFAFFLLHPRIVEKRNLVLKKRLAHFAIGPSDVEDVMQSMDLSLWRVFQRETDIRGWIGKSEGRFGGWTYELFDRLCLPIVIALRQKALRRPNYQSTSIGPDDWDMVEDRHESQTALLEQIIDVREKLADLPERTVRVVSLRWLGYTWDEIAEELGITSDAAKWALDSWRDELEKRFGPNPP